MAESKFACNRRVSCRSTREIWHLSATASTCQQRISCPDLFESCAAEIPERDVKFQNRNCKVTGGCRAHREINGRNNE